MARVESARVGRRAMFATFLAAALLAIGSSGLGTARLMADEASPKVKLIIDYGDDVQKHFSGIEWKKEMTVANAVDAAVKHPRGIRVETRGAGESLFLMKLDDVKNEGRARNWLFYVNEKRGEQSYGITKVQPGDVILWKFGEYR